MREREREKERGRESTHLCIFCCLHAICFFSDIASMDKEVKTLQKCIASKSDISVKWKIMMCMSQDCQNFIAEFVKLLIFLSVYNKEHSNY